MASSPKKSFVLYTDHIDFIRELDQADKALLLDAIFMHASGEPIEVHKNNKPLYFVWLAISKQMNRESAKWDEEKRKRADAGRLGGLAKSSNAKQSQAEPSEAKECLASLADNVPVLVPVPVPEKKEEPSKYAFSGKYIRIDRAQFQKWEVAFSYVNLLTELYGLDDWLAKEDASGRTTQNWFWQVPQALAKKNLKLKEERGFPA